MESHKSNTSAKSEKPICFVISPIGEEGTETRKRADQVLRHVIRPPATECGYKAIRADEISEAGMITSQVIEQIVDAPLVIADLTDRNANVYYELAIRHVIRKPFVQIVKKGEQLPFDIAGMRTIPVDLLDLDSIEDAKREIAAQIESLEKDPSKLQTPISVSLDLKVLRQSADPEQRSIADVLSMLTELRSSVGNLETRFDAPDIRKNALFLEEELKRARTEIEAVRAQSHEVLFEREQTYKRRGEYIELLRARAEGDPTLFATTDSQVAEIYKAAGWLITHRERLMVNGRAIVEFTLRWPHNEPPIHRLP